MKTKTSSKRIALLGSALLALSIFAPAVEAITLDNPFQTVVAPLSGTTIVDFSGTVTLQPNYQFLEFPFLTPPSNLSGSNILDASFTAEFLAFLDTPVQPFTQTFTGLIFDVSVPAGTPPGLYAFSELVGSAEIELISMNEIGELIIESEIFGVLVTPVPDRGSSILFLGLSLAALCSVQRAFASRAKRS